MATTFNPGRDAPEPDDTLMSDPFELMLETEGRELLSQRYDYIAELLEYAFEDIYLQLFASSKLHYEIINLISLCTSIMNSFDFPRRSNDSLKKAITAIMKSHLEKCS